jgi:hypothetical protein
MKSLRYCFRGGVLLAFGSGVLALSHAAPGPTSASPQTTNTVSVLTAEQVVQILDESVEWYGTLTTQQQVATQPSDLIVAPGTHSVFKYSSRVLF